MMSTANSILMCLTSFSHVTLTQTKHLCVPPGITNINNTFYFGDPGLLGCFAGWWV
jgi:hypothetical protein